MTRKELPARAANIQRAVASTATCTPATVESLRSYLVPAGVAVHVSNKKAENAEPPRRNAHAAKQAKAGGPTARRQPAVAVLELSKEGGFNEVLPQERFELATEVINTSLRALTEAIKNPPTQKTTTSLARSPSNFSSSDGSSARTHAPLQPICVNRLTNSPGKQSHFRRSSSTTSLNQQLDGLRAQAECARIAFATLRSLQGCKGLPNLPPLQLETGMSALIGKLIALAFDELAIKELRILKRRLETSKESSTLSIGTANAKSFDVEDASKPHGDTLVSMLRYRNVGAKGPVLALIITSQLQVVRILALRKDVSAIEAALQYLQLDIRSSPANMIRQQIELEAPATLDKGARQLESLAKSLLALCPGASASEDEKMGKSGSTLPPETSLQFQCLAFRIRLIWWELSGHRGDVVTELIDPFCHCLSAFRRRSRQGKEVKYVIARSMCETITKPLQDVPGFREDMLFTVHQMLADLAQDSLQKDEAIEWYKKSMDSAILRGASQTQLCAMVCRFASLQIRVVNSDSTNDALKSLHDAASKLRSDLQGASADLDELLIAVASLRKSAFFLFQESQRSPAKTITQIPSTLANGCKDVVLLCVNFMVRYLGNGPAKGEDERIRGRREQRTRAIAQIINPTVDSVVAMARLLAGSSLEVWQKLEAGLRDCFRLVAGLGDEKIGQRGNGEKPISSSFVSISNAYWTRYLHLVRGAAEPRSLKECLGTSIEIIKDRSTSEKVAGFLSKKLEKYAQLYENMRDYKNATEAYRIALCAQLSDSCLMLRVQEAAKHRSLSDAFENNAELEILSKVLLAYPRMAVKAAEKGECLQAFYDLEELDIDERGLLLEQQLVSICSIVAEQGPIPIIQRDLNALANILLLLYSENGCPVRRLRVIVRLHSICLTRPGALDTDVEKKLFQEPAGSSLAAHSDMGLLRYLPYLIASRKILAGIWRPESDIESMKSIIYSWAQLAQENPDWSSLKTQVCDITDWLMQLELLAEYLDMQGLDLIRVSVLNILVKIHESATLLQNSTLVLKLSELGVLYVRLGYSGMAGLILHKAQRYLEASDLHIEVVIRWHLSYAEYALVSGNLTSCKESLGRAGNIFKESLNSADVRKPRSRDLSEQSQLIGDAYYIYSLLAAAEGLASSAVFLARLYVKNIQRAWAYLERSRSRLDRKLHNGQVGSDKESFVDVVFSSSSSEHTSAQNVAATPILALSTAAFWKLVPRLFRGLTHTSLLFVKHGVLPEVRYYLEQSQKIANAVCAPSLIGQCFALLGQQSFRSGEVEEATPLLQQAEANLSSMQPDLNYARLQLFLAMYHRAKNDFQAGESASAIAEHTIQRLTARKFFDSLICKPPTVEDLETKISGLTLQEDKPFRQPLRNQGRAMSKRTATDSSAQQKPTKAPATDIPAIEVIGLNRLRCEIIQERIHSSIRQSNLDAAATMLDVARLYIHGHQCSVLQALLESQLYFRQSLERLIGDPVLCAIPESTVSCPSVKASADRQPRQSAVKASQVSPDKKRLKIQRNRGLAKTSRPKSPCTAKVETNLLRLAHETLSDIFSLARQVSSTATLHRVSDALSKVLITLSATSSSALGSPVSASLLVYVLEVGRIFSMIRQSSAIQVERQLCQNKETYEWPEYNTLQDLLRIRSRVEVDYASFQAEYIDIIPADWTVVSISLSECRDDIIICKIRAGQAPFVLRLPLSRHSSMDCAEEAFGFEHAKAELQDIIVLANRSAQGAQDVSRKGAKTEWWNTRDTLDARLKDLLINIENIWLGGFRGIFSPRVQDRELLSRFQQSFLNILDKHLPSRQKSRRRIQTSRITLDPHVLELFASLGCPSDSNDVDEPLMDLLYFVVDILQFNGERNAYDEVDFDSIAIETVDALRQYHHAADNEAHDDLELHTILILDKNLHGFPWESMPCLTGQAISRLPSLGCLRDRILQVRNHQKQLSLGTPREANLHINRHDGSSILNPAGELKATQERLEEQLHGLSGWETIIQREPTEAEMKSCVEDHDLFLYFGHGSGGSYIRSRTIKKLQKCAVAFLMGCSSGALTEAGEFEPYGMPINYMHAGCPALVANLWDVTDKDIDRFSQTVLEEWGLFGRAQSQCSPGKRSTNQRTKSKMEMERSHMKERYDCNHLSLDQAVASGRDSCKLRYLNGAAPVVYGVPVYLS